MRCSYCDREVDVADEKNRIVSGFYRDDIINFMNNNLSGICTVEETNEILFDGLDSICVCPACILNEKVVRCGFCKSFRELGDVELHVRVDNETMNICCNCRDEVSYCDRCGNLFSELNNGLCDDCYNRCNQKCIFCGEKSTHSIMLDNKNESVCDKCSRKRLDSCQSCGRYFLKEKLKMAGPENKIPLCDVCLQIKGSKYTKDSILRSVVPRHNPHRSYLLQSQYDRAQYPSAIHGKPSKIFKTDRLIGIELEACSGDIRRVSERLDKRIGIVYDGSIAGDGREFVTPPMSGTSITEIIRKMTKEIRDANFWVDRSCGFHLHIDARDIKRSSKKLSNILKTYLSVEDAFYSVLPPSRLISRFSQPLCKFFNYDDFNVKTTSRLEDLWYEKTPTFNDIVYMIANYKTRVDPRNQSLYGSRKDNKYLREQWYSDDELRSKIKKSMANNHTCPGRYLGLNFHSLYHRGTIEIRHHSGTLNSNKILRWIELNLAIFDYAINRFNEDAVKKVRDSAVGYSKLIQMFKTFGFSKKCLMYLVDRHKAFSRKDGFLDFDAEEKN